uniref:Uncharacterized protein n=1 Tax=Branchiostoma floridae TaxID=7739 RepID=C3Y4P0_BRAFL|eukprot:XP_002608687.1 hypothetical protein BRAFLDRAFT_73909 [Branchiostoma floridae]
MADERKSERTRLVNEDTDDSRLESIFQTTSESHPDTDRTGRFSSKLGLIISCVGCAVGTGNLWRFPRILANNSGEKGCLQFLLVWLVFLFLWSMQIIIMEYAIELLGTPRLWIDALSQNAWDTGAASGVFLVYGASMTENMGPVKTGILIPLLNNAVSLMSGTMVFCTVFSTWTKVSPGGYKDDLMKLLKTNGPANTGLTFIW